MGQILTLAARKYPERTALICGAERVTYQAFNSRVNQLAHALIGLGLKKGDKVAALFYNSISFVETYFAAIKAGGVFVPVNFRFVGEEAVYILNQSDSRFFFFGEEFGGLVESLRSAVPKVDFFFAAGSAPAAGTGKYEDLLKGAPDSEPPVPLSEDDECQIMYTSGTTGKPKGAVITHRNVLWNMFNTILGREEKREEVSLVVGPLYHTAALNNHFTLRVALGGTSILVKEFDARQLLETISREKVTVISGAPALFHFLLNLPEKENYDTRSVTKCTTGASILPDETKEKLLRFFPNIRGIYDVYGCTECAPNICILKARDSLRKKESVGPPLPFLEVRIVDEQDRPLPADTVGELTCRGPNVMKGYYKDPEGTAEALRGGWLHTGDLARMDEEGFVYIVDRKKDMIISGGENIYPRELEEVLYRHPQIQDAAVVGIPDPLWGESVRAFVVVRKGASLTAEEVVEYCKAHLASYKKPRSVVFVDSLPRNPSGKVLKTVLRAAK
jgi:acyl-CoA synthetase (AMP-forming)/AMP-acid ligase II